MWPFKKKPEPEVKYKDFNVKRLVVRFHKNGSVLHETYVVGYVAKELSWDINFNKFYYSKIVSASTVLEERLKIAVTNCGMFTLDNDMSYLININHIDEIHAEEYDHYVQAVDYEG